MDPAVATDLIHEMHQLNARISHLEGFMDKLKQAKNAVTDTAKKAFGHGELKTSNVSHALEAFEKDVTINENTFTLPKAGVTVVWEKPASFTISKDGETYPANGLDDLTKKLKALMDLHKPMKVPADMRALTTAVLRQQGRWA